MFFRLVATRDGTAVLAGDGQSVRFFPTMGFTGTATFDVVADDGFGFSDPLTVAITVSDAPLVGLEIVEESELTLLLDVGERHRLEVVGTFTDQSDVPLPPSYVDLTSLAPEIVAMDSETGWISALAEGHAIIRAARGPLAAVNVANVGLPTAAEALHFVLGLDIHPGALALAANSGQRQLVVQGLLGSEDLTAGASGTRYFSQNPSVATVSSDGLVVAGAPGTTVITVIHESTKTAIPVRVEQPQSGPVNVGPNGSVLVGDDGALLTIPPGALDEEVTIELTTLAMSQLPLAVPDGWTFVAGYDLQFGDEGLSEPAQLALSVPPNLATDHQFYVFRQGLLPDENGNLSPVWFQDEIANIGDDGILRTQSPPFPGVEQSGVYFLGAASNDSVRVAGGRITVNTSIGGVMISLGGQFATAAPSIAFTIDISSLDLIAIPKQGLPIVTSVGVEIAAGEIGTFSTEINPPIAAPFDPVIEQIEFTFFNNEEPALILRGRNFSHADGAATQSQQIIQFHYGEEVYDAEILGGISGSPGSQEEVTVAVPRAVVLGLSEVTVTREDTILELDGSQVVTVDVLYQSNAVSLNAAPRYVVAALRSTDQIAVMSEGDPFVPGASPEEESQAIQLLARIPVGDSPRAVALAKDGLRAYVTSIGSQSISVVDLVTLREVDVEADPLVTGGPLNRIELPSGARPFWIAVDSEDRYAYASDESAAVVYVIGIDPANRDEFHQLVQTITLPSDSVPHGLRGLDISSDGRRLFVAAPNRRLFAGTARDTAASRLFVINIDARNRPAEGQPNAERYRQVIGEFETGQETWAVEATDDPGRITFTNRSNDSEGFGILTVTNDDPTGFQAQITTLGLRLGSFSDYLDVNNGQGIELLPAGMFGDHPDYAFVSGFNRYQAGVLSRDPFSGALPGGSTIGLIRDPFGPEARLVAATAPIPIGLLDNLALAAGSRYLFAGYRRVLLEGGAGPSDKGAVFVYDVETMIGNVEKILAGGSGLLESTPLQRLELDAGGNVTVIDIEDAVGPNVVIDLKADYRIVEADFARGQFRFDIPEGSPFGPLATGGSPQGLDALQNPLKLISPVSSGDVATDLTPLFVWEILDSRPGWSSQVFVSVLDPIRGLWPTDDKFDFQRIVNGAEAADPGSGANWTFDLSDVYADSQLADALELTAGQTYYWGVKAISPDGAVFRSAEFFETGLEAPSSSQTFTGVTLLTHGFEFNLSAGIPGTVDELDGDLTELGRLAEAIAEASGAVTMVYNPDGHLNPQANQKPLWSPLHAGVEPELGKPLVLIANWIKESDIDDSGFTEGAADALFAALVRFDQEHQGALMNSPLHFIGHGRGAVVNSEILQRLGKHFPEVDDIHMTTLDPHDFVQSRLKFEALETLIGQLADVKIEKVRKRVKQFVSKAVKAAKKITKVIKLVEIFDIHWDDFGDPKVQIWNNVSFADNYYQTTAIEPDVASSSQLDLIPTFTHNGRAIEGAFNVALDGRAGFTVDGIEIAIPDVGFTSLVSLGINQKLEFEERSFGLGANHDRVVSWYTGTADLNTLLFDGEDSDVIVRRALLAEAYPELDSGELGQPWYSPWQLSFAAPETPSEGTGTGWYFSTLGGSTNRPPVPEPNVIKVPDFDGGVPDVFNGDFEWGMKQAEFGPDEILMRFSPWWRIARLVLPWRTWLRV